MRVNASPPVRILGHKASRQNKKAVVGGLSGCGSRPAEHDGTSGRPTRGAVRRLWQGDGHGHAAAARSNSARTLDSGPVPSNRVLPLYIVAGTSTPSKGRPLHVEDFWRDGRGPETHRVIWNATGTSIRAIEYLNPDWTDIDSDLCHVIL